MSCYIFYGIMPPREPGDVTPGEIAIKLGWVEPDEWGDVPGDYDVWEDEVRFLKPDQLGMDVQYVDCYPLTHIYAEGTVLHCEDEYPLAFDELPVYTEEQQDQLFKLAKVLGMGPPSWHLLASNEDY